MKVCHPLLENSLCGSKDNSPDKNACENSKNGIQGKMLHFKAYACIFLASFLYTTWKGEVNTDALQLLPVFMSVERDSNAWKKLNARGMVCGQWICRMEKWNYYEKIIKDEGGHERSIGLRICVWKWNLFGMRTSYRHGALCFENEKILGA